MSFTAIVSGLFAIAKAVPIIMDAVEKLSNMFIDYKVSKIKDTYNIKTNKLAVLKKMLVEAKTDEEIITLSIVIDGINKL